MPFSSISAGVGEKRKSPTQSIFFKTTHLFRGGPLEQLRRGWGIFELHLIFPCMNNVFSTIHSNTICMRSGFDPLSRAFQIDGFSIKW